MPGQQNKIFNFTTLALLGQIALNVHSAARQHLPLKNVMSGFFVEIATSNYTERVLRFLLITWFVLGFVVDVIEIQVKGNKIVNTDWSNNR